MEHINASDTMSLTNNLQIELFDVWDIDYMGPFPKSYYCVYIFVVMDYVSRWAEALPFELPTPSMPRRCSTRLSFRAWKSLVCAKKTPSLLSLSSAPLWCDNEELRCTIWICGLLHMNCSKALVQHLRCTPEGWVLVFENNMTWSVFQCSSDPKNSANSMFFLNLSKHANSEWSPIGNTLNLS
jgi:hypothetical protein